jgi:hypothetical protein
MNSPWLFILIHYLGVRNRPLVAKVQRHNLTLSTQTTTSEIIISGKVQKCAGAAILGGKCEKCRKVITSQQKLYVLKWYNNKNKVISILPA